MGLGAASAIAGGVSMVGGIAKTVGGIIGKNKWEDRIENYDRQELMNPYENLKVSTEGAMMKQRNSAVNTATALHNLRMSGTNAVFGNTQKVISENNRVNQGITSDIDRQLNRNEYLKATGEMQVQRMTERREEGDLAGMGAQYEANRQDAWGGVSDFTQGAGVLAGSEIWNK